MPSFHFKQCLDIVFIFILGKNILIILFVLDLFITLSGGWERIFQILLSCQRTLSLAVPVVSWDQPRVVLHVTADFAQLGVLHCQLFPCILTNARESDKLLQRPSRLPPCCITCLLVHFYLVCYEGI